MGTAWARLSSGDSEGAAQHAAAAVDLLSTTDCGAFKGRALDVLGRSLLVSDRTAAVEAWTRAAEVFESCGSVWRREEALAAVAGEAAPVGTRPPTVRTTRTGDLGREAADAPDLTLREVDVLRLVARGLSNQQVADDLVISVRTVERHLTNIYQKLGETGRVARAHATFYGMRHGLIPT